jgi:hypothetical protein
VLSIPNDGYITWTKGNKNGDRVNLGPSSPTATFTFGIEAPIGATWRAEFVTIKGKQNAFKFTQGLNANISADGSYATGEIGVGGNVTLEISTTGFAEVENNEAYLRLFVITPYGTTISVPSKKSENDDNDYVIVQTP